MLACSTAILSAALMPLACLAAEPTQAGQERAKLTPEQLMKLSLEDLMQLKVATVTTASKMAERATEAPGTTIVITEQDIRVRGYSQLTDVIRDLPGMDPAAFYHSEIGTNVAVRGIVGNNKIIVLVNGMRVNPPGGEEMRLSSDFSVRNAKQIEVVYGPGSTLYGQDAISAVINIKTKEPTEHLTVEAGGDGGFNSTRDIWGSFGKVFDKERNISFTGFIHYHDSDLTPLDRDYPQYWQDYRAFAAPRGDGTVPFRQDFGLNAFGRFQIKDTSLQIWYRKSRRSASEGILPTFGFTEASNWTDQSLVTELKNIYKITDRVKLESSVTYNWYEIDPQTQFAPAAPTSWINDFKYGTGDGLTFEEVLKVDFTDRFSAMIGATGSRFTGIPKASIPGGLDPNRDVVQQAGNIVYFTKAGDPSSMRTVPRATEYSYHTYGGYAEVNWKITNKVKAIIGARVDQDSRLDEPSFTPRASLIWQVTPSFTAKYSYARAYIAPSSYFSLATFSNAAVVLAPNDRLKPEKAESHEIAFNYSKEHLQLGLSLYYGNQSALIKSPLRGAQGGTILDPIFLDAAGTQRRRLVQAVNGGDSMNIGADFFGRATFGSVSTWFSYSYVDYKEKNAGVTSGLFAISKHNGRLGATWAVTPKFFITPSLVIRSTPENVDGGRLAAEVKIPWEVNLHALYAPTEHVEIFATVSNLTNHDYALGGPRAATAGGNPRAIPQESFQAVCGLKLLF